MDWETFTTKLIPWTLITMGIVTLGSFIAGCVYVWYHNHKIRSSR